MRLSTVNFIRKSWSKSFNNGIVYNRVGFNFICATISRQYTELFFKIFTRAAESGWSISEISYPSMYQNVTKGKFMFYDKKLSKLSEFYYLEPGLYPSNTDIVEAMNTLNQKRHNHSEKCITVKEYRRTQKVEINLAKEGSGLAFFSTVLGHVFGSNVSFEFGEMLRGKGPHKPEFAPTVRIHSLMIYTDLIEYINAGETKTPLLRCYPFILKLKARDIKTTGQYMNYQTFSNLQFRPLLKNCFRSIYIDLRDKSDENILFVTVGIFVLFWCSEKLPTFISNLKDVTRWLLQEK